MNCPAQQYEKELDQYFTALTDLKNFNGNVKIAKNNTILLDKTYNILEADKALEVNKNSKFIIASVSKIFVKYGILKLAEQGKLKLSDTLNKYIPRFPSGEKITIEHLLFHQSGLPREIKDYEKYDHLSLEKIIELAQQESLQFEPGTQTLYSNVGYFILHYIIGKLSDKGYWNFIQTEIIKKYKLKSTGEFNSAQSLSDFAYGFSGEDGKITPVSHTNINRFETGNYFSTTDDLYSFSQQLISGKNLRKDLVLKMFGKNSQLIQAGGRPGYRAYYYQDLKSGITFIFTSNFTDIPFQKVTEDIINLLNGQSYSVPRKINKKAIEVPDEILKQYTGKFALEADQSQVFNIILENHFLYILDKDGEKTKIYPESSTSFFDNPKSEDGYQFLKGSDQQYYLIIISTGVKLNTKRIQ
ncbi:CubicO group peptidase (beta-lactamase class C family) [Chryseobacterium sediminis]|uniref:CubicO group peptidase (Beta-lactamase class C family) n=1 Tax=Chryseobacterium sediminis TaxID=1679494 RepID=A0ABR6Q0Q0_9FLAO|nr:serine hydrolase domain-containing protein [Chryseobacterium sediminis]MBB6331553.1 CubicO group peptidase (beta-lactamase class C family) [Chryseobacterium sediminis]